MGVNLCFWILGLFLALPLEGIYPPLCQTGYTISKIGSGCSDTDECVEDPSICGNHSTCFNTLGSYHCQCHPGFESRIAYFTSADGGCTDIDECGEDRHICGEWGTCHNRKGSYWCSCLQGFHQEGDISSMCVDVNECIGAGNKYPCGQNGTCWNLEGSYRCHCPPGFTTYGNNQSRCQELNCDPFATQSTPEQTLPGFDSLLSHLRNNCLVLINSSGLAGATEKTGEALLTVLANVTDVLQLQSNGQGGNSGKVTTLLRTVENSIRLIAPQLKENVSRINTSHTEVEVVVRRDRTPPRGPVRLTNENIQLDTTWETAIGDDTNFPGFAFAILLSYKSLQTLTNSSVQLSSRVVTVSVSNPNTTNLSEPIILTFNHLKSSDANTTCVYWSEDGEGAWSIQGCASVMSNSTHTVCSCTHLSSFALLRGIQENKKCRQLQLVMWAGASVALACVVLSLLMTLWCRFVSKKRNGGSRPEQHFNP
ncbi:adhesion G protein-coupled receptor E2-like isoform X1 [Oncorhynchus keta]|uniref:adhesion G protein-coupled receptor E2-like isoform X1 n=1 Tax=Oncorhynchus keta TaxID=8018 RepID=UPI0015FBEB23|nr:adhesion G protein-coupled receptor E2-like isoform X1 [Oncorhynchus keta]